MRITQVRAIIVVGFLAVIAIATSWFAIAGDSQTAAGREKCPPGAIPVDISLPEPEDVQVTVLNATKNDGLADTASSQLKDYGFDVIETGDSDKDEDDMEASVEIYYGPKTVAAGHLLRSYFAEEAHFFKLDYEEDYVKVILGSGFQQLYTESDARNALSDLGWPEAPEGTCALE